MLLAYRAIGTPSRRTAKRASTRTATGATWRQERACRPRTT